MAANGQKRTLVESVYWKEASESIPEGTRQI